MYHRLLCNSRRCMCACVCVCSIFMPLVQVNGFVVIQRRHKVPTFHFLAPIVYFQSYYSKPKKHANSHTKITKKNSFTINLDPKSSDLFIFQSFINQIPINLNHISSHFPFNIKNTNKFILPLGFFILKTLFKTNKKHTTNQTSISTPNYEVLIPHGYVGKGTSPSKSIKNVDKQVSLFLFITLNSIF